MLVVFFYYYLFVCTLGRSRELSNTSVSERASQKVNGADDCVQAVSFIVICKGVLRQMRRMWAWLECKMRERQTLCISNIKILG